MTFKKIIDWFKYKGYDRPTPVWIEVLPGVGEKGFALGKKMRRIQCWMKDVGIEYFSENYVIGRRDKYGDWCDDCGAPQMVLPNGEHACGREDERD